MLKPAKPQLWRAIIFLLISAGLFLLFVKLADEVNYDRSLDALDQTVASAVYDLRTPAATQIMLGITSLAATPAIIIFSAATIAIMYVIQQRRHIWPLVLAILGAGVFAFVFKELFSRPRPSLTSALVTEVGFSFPSGHTLIGICFYGVLVYFLVMAVRPLRAKVAIAIVGTLLVLAIGFSRVYLGAHWPTDVIASLLLGSSWLFFLGAIFQYYERIANFLRRLPI